MSDQDGALEPPGSAGHGGKLSRRAAAMAECLASWPRKRVTLAELLRLFDDVDPASRASARRRGLLESDLTELAAAGRIQLPARNSYDRAIMPHLPRFVMVQNGAGKKTGNTAADLRRVVWHSSLAWIFEARLTGAQVEQLKQVNDWLHRCGGSAVVPVRERSWEIFGDEKAIDRLETTMLFAPGRLDLSLLSCRRVVPRFVWERVGPGNILLVVENSDTFDSLVTVLRARTESGSSPQTSGTAVTAGPGHRVGLVAWGAGAAFEASVLSIANLPVTEVRYFGDLDDAGLRIPANAAANANRCGLSFGVVPAAGLYAALLSVGRPTPGQRRLPEAEAIRLCSWLASNQQQPVVQLLTSGQRMAQEAVGYAYLSQDPSWLLDL